VIGGDSGCAVAELIPEAAARYVRACARGRTGRRAIAAISQSMLAKGEMTRRGSEFLSSCAATALGDRAHHALAILAEIGRRTSPQCSQISRSS
jgi:hypothetical protein